MSKQLEPADAGTDIPAPLAGEQELQKVWHRVVGRRGFLRQAGLASAVAVPASAVAVSTASARSRHGLRGGPTAGDFAIPRFPCAAEIIESELWEPYARCSRPPSTQ